MTDKTKFSWEGFRVGFGVTLAGIFLLFLAILIIYIIYDTLKELPIGVSFVLGSVVLIGIIGGICAGMNWEKPIERKSKEQ